MRTALRPNRPFNQVAIVIMVLCIIKLDSIGIGNSAYEELKVEKQTSTYSLSLSHSLRAIHSCRAKVRKHRHVAQTLF